MRRLACALGLCRGRSSATLAPIRRAAPGRKQTLTTAGQHDGKREHDQIESRVSSMSGTRSRHPRAKERLRPHREQEPGDRADAAEHARFRSAADGRGATWSRQARAGSWTSRRRADGSRQQQVRDVRRADEQNAADRAEQTEEGQRDAGPPACRGAGRSARRRPGRSDAVPRCPRRARSVRAGLHRRSRLASAGRRTVYHGAATL